MTTDNVTPQPATNPRVERFLAEVGEIKADDGSRDVRMARVGLGLAVVGVVLALLALVLSQQTDNYLNQTSDLSLGIAGLALSVLGAALFLYHSMARFLRFWLLRMIFQQESRR